MRPLRVLLVLVLVAVIAFLGISWKYADGVTRVTRDPLEEISGLRSSDQRGRDVQEPRRADAEGMKVPRPGPVPATGAAVMVDGKDQDRIDGSFAPGRLARSRG